MKRGWWVLIGVIVIAGAVLVLMARRNPGSESGDMGPLEIGPETTRIVAPLTNAGAVDYLAALNAEGVPDAADNAAVGLLRVLGTDRLIGDVPAVLRQLGAPQALPVTGSFVAAPEEVAEALDLTEERRERAGDPAIARWIADNGDAIDGLVDASRRPRLWWPVVRDPEGGMISLALPAPLLSDVVDALATRAEFACAGGDLRAAWSDIEALLRLHRLVDQMPGLISRLVAGSFHGMAMDCLKTVFETASPDEALGAEVLRVLEDVPPPRDLVPDIDVFVRFFVLDGFMRQSAGDAQNGPVVGLNPALRALNEGIDEMVSVLLETEDENGGRVARLVEERMERVQALNNELETPIGKLRHGGAAVVTGGASASRVAGEIVATTALSVVPMVVDRIREREARRRIALIAAALRLHALRNGAFPGRLAALDFAQFAELPANFADGSDVPYVRTERGCRVGDEDWAIELVR